MLFCANQRQLLWNFPLLLFLCQFPSKKKKRRKSETCNTHNASISIHGHPHRNKLASDFFIFLEIFCFSIKMFFIIPPFAPSLVTLEDHNCGRYSKRPNTIYLCSGMAEVARQRVGSYYTRRQKKKKALNTVKEALPFSHQGRWYCWRRAQRWQKSWCVWWNKWGQDPENEFLSEASAAPVLFLSRATNKTKQPQSLCTYIYFLWFEML